MRHLASTLLLALPGALTIPSQLPLPAAQEEESTRAEAMRRGLEWMAAGDFASARLHWDERITAHPDWADAYSQRAYCLVRLGDRGGALADYNRALELQPENPTALMARGDLHLAQRDFSLGARDFLAALHIDRELVPAHLRLAFLLGTTHLSSTALEHFDFVLSREAGAAGQVHLWRWWLARETGLDPAATDAGFSNWLEQAQARPGLLWDCALARFALGQMPRHEIDLLALEKQAEWTAMAPSPLGRVTQVAFLAGLLAEWRGEIKQALAEQQTALTTFEQGVWEWEAARNRLRQLAQKHQLQPYFGFKTAELDPRFAELSRLDRERCRAIHSVDGKSFAGRAGLIDGDVLISLEGKPATAVQVGAVLDSCIPGDLLRLEYMRMGKSRRCSLLIGVRL